MPQTSTDAGFHQCTQYHNIQSLHAQTATIILVTFLMDLIHYGKT